MWSYRVRSAASASALQSSINELARDGWELTHVVVMRDSGFAFMRRERQPGDDEQEAAEHEQAHARSVWSSS